MKKPKNGPQNSREYSANEPWFNPGLVGGVLGGTVGILGGILGTAVGVLGPRGKAKSLVMGLWLATMGCAVIAGVLVYLASRRGDLKRR